jgi:2-methylcitrate dehydratase PrpD
MTLSEELASASVAAYSRELTTSELAMAADRVIDGMACAVTGAGTEVAGEVARLYSSPIPVTGGAQTFYGEWLAPADAATVNGTLMHSLDYDDSIVDSAIHPGGVIVPAALAIGETSNSTIRDVLRAVAVGYDVASGIGVVVNPAATKPHHMRGFHTTTTIGMFGAAVAGGLLLGLDADGINRALGVAGSSAAGLLQVIDEGGDLKRVQVGLASARGVTAALLGTTNISTPAHIFEGRFGFLQAYGVFEGRERPEDVNFVRPYRGVSQAGTKLYAACGHVHPVVECLRAVAAGNTIDPEQIDSVLIRMPALWHSITGIPSRLEPSELCEAQMSVYIAAAMTLTFGTLRVRDFLGGAWSRPEIRSLAHRVQAVPDERLSDALIRGEKRVEVTITMKDGSQYSGAEVGLRGLPDDPDIDAKIAAKLTDAYSLWLGDEAATEAADSLVAAVHSAHESVQDVMTSVSDIIAGHVKPQLVAT